MGAGVPRPCSAKRANASMSPGTPARIIIAPMLRVSSRPRNGGWSCQPVINHGTSPASVHGATTKKTAEPRTALVRCTAVPDTRRCELIPTSPSSLPVDIRAQRELDAPGREDLAAVQQHAARAVALVIPADDGVLAAVAAGGRLVGREDHVADDDEAAAQRAEGSALRSPGRGEVPRRHRLYLVERAVLGGRRGGGAHHAFVDPLVGVVPDLRL